MLATAEGRRLTLSEIFHSPRHNRTTSPVYTRTENDRTCGSSPGGILWQTASLRSSSRALDRIPADALAALIPAVIAVLVGKGRSPADAEDHAEEAALRYYAAHEPIRSVQAWLTLVALNVGTAEWRKPKPQRLTDAEGFLTDPSAERDFERVEVVEAVRAAVTRLPATWQRMVVLELDGVSQAEIARRCGCNRNTVHDRLTAAHERLRGMLGEQFTR